MSAILLPPCSSRAHALPPLAAHTVSRRNPISRLQSSCSVAPITGRSLQFVQTHLGANRGNRTGLKRNLQRPEIAATSKPLNGSNQDVSPSERFIHELEAAQYCGESESERQSITILQEQLEALHQLVSRQMCSTLPSILQCHE